MSVPWQVQDLMKRRLPVVLGDLYSPEGNAFFVLGRCRAAMTQANCTRQQIDSFLLFASRGTYATLLETVLDCFSVTPEAERQAHKLIREHGGAK